MPEETVLDGLGIESDEADEAWESDEAFMEADDSVEDLGEAQRRRRRYSRQRPAVRGVRGMTMRDADGRARNVAFPARLATTAETNRGLASQEVARRALEERIHRLEARNRQQQNNGAAISGIVTLVIGGGLTALSLFKAAQPAQTGVSLSANPGANSTVFSRSANEETAKMATLTSVTQLAATGARALVNRGYPHSGLGIAADAFAAVQIAGYTLASLLPPSQQSKSSLAVTSVATADQVTSVIARPDAATGDYVYAQAPSADGKNVAGWYVLSSAFPNGGSQPSHWGLLQVRHRAQRPQATPTLLRQRATRIAGACGGPCPMSTGTTERLFASTNLDPALAEAVEAAPAGGFGRRHPLEDPSHVPPSSGWCRASIGSARAASRPGRPGRSAAIPMSSASRRAGR